MSASSRNPSFLLFLIELRARLMRVLLVLFLLFAVLMYAANQLYAWLAEPLLHFLPQGHLIATEMTSAFFVPFKLAFVVSVWITMPYGLYQIWQFVAPALYRHERRTTWLFLLISTFLFYTGMAFAYFIIFPLLFHFLAQVAPKGVMISPDISAYLDFATRLLFMFGVLFEIPMVMVLLSILNVVKVATWKKYRPYAIVGAFVVGMILAPPDVLSQTILAIPIWLLYEIGIIMMIFSGLIKYEKNS
jgi:sec-independent protein translocase protein TatC